MEKIAVNYEIDMKSDVETYPINRLMDNYNFIQITYNTLNEHIKNNIGIYPAGEWLLDNLYIIEQTNGRLSDTTSSITKNKENNTGEIFKNEGELPKRIQKRVIRGIDDRWQNGRTFRRNRTDSSKENEANNNKFSRKEPNNRENEKRESNGVGTSNELNKKPSRGND